MINLKKFPKGPTGEEPPFTLSKGCSKAIELLNEKMYTNVYDEFKVPKTEIVYIYRLLFQLVNFPDIHQNLSDAEHWRRVVSYFRMEAKGKIGQHLKDITDKLDFSNKNILEISKLIENHAKNLTPSYYSKICGATGFVVFYIKDALDYCGILDEKKSSPHKIHKFLSYKQKIYQEILKKLSLMDEMIKK